MHAFIRQVLIVRAARVLTAAGLGAVLLGAPVCVQARVHGGEVLTERAYGAPPVAMAAAPRMSQRPQSRTLVIPPARWDHRPDGRLWTRAAIKALRSHGRVILQTVPRDIGAWCPAYPDLDLNGRAAFWAGLLSALAKHESTYRQTAVGGGGRWYGLLQILPATARGYNSADPSRQGLKSGSNNVSCAVRILATTVPRDQVVSQGMRGVAADWGPFHSRRKREDMRQWVRKQAYCIARRSLRPRARPRT
ncbi:MAG: transglycosylase SLT domain-containing protein [Pseudomonadota bacterium]